MADLLSSSEVADHQIGGGYEHHHYNQQVVPSTEVFTSEPDGSLRAPWGVHKPENVYMLEPHDPHLAHHDASMGPEPRLNNDHSLQMADSDTEPAFQGIAHGVAGSNEDVSALDGGDMRGKFSVHNFDINGSDEPWNQGQPVGTESSSSVSPEQPGKSSAVPQPDRDEHQDVQQEWPTLQVDAPPRPISRSQTPEPSLDIQLPNDKEAAVHRIPEKHFKLGAASRLSNRLTLQPLSAIGKFRPQQRASRQGSVASTLNRYIAKAHEPVRRASHVLRANEQGELQSSDVDEAIGDLASKIRRKSKAESAKFDADRQALNMQLRQALNEKQALETRLSVLGRERVGLSTTIDNQTAKLASFGSKTSRLKAFVDGLGNDLDAIRKESSVQRQMSERLASEASENKSTHEALLETMAAGAEKSAELKHEALQAFREAKAELAACEIRYANLKQQLGDKVGLLSEEKQLRLQLQTQLNNTTSLSETINRSIKSNVDPILDKLFEVHASLEHGSHNSSIAEMLESVAAALQGLNSQQTATLEDVTSVKGLVDKLSESLDHQVDSRGQADESETSMRTYLDEKLTDLKTHLSQQEQLVNQEATNRNTIARLEEKLKGMQVIETKLRESEASEASLKEHMTSLQSQITAGATADQEAEMRANELSTALDTTKADLVAKETQLEELRNAKLGLETQVDSLQQGIRDLESSAAHSTNSEEYRKQVAEEVEKARAEMSKHSDDYKAVGNADAHNEKKRLVGETKRLTEEMRNLETRLANANSKIEGYRDQDIMYQNKQKEVEDLQQLTGDLQAENQALKANQVEVDSVQDELKQKRSQNSALGNQVAAEKKGRAEVLDQCKGLQIQVESLERDIQSARNSEQQVKEQVADLNQKLHQAEDGNKRLNASCQEVLEKTRQTSDKNIRDLQTRTADAEARLVEADAKHQEFVANVERSWEAAGAKHEAELVALRGKLAEAEAAKQEAVADYQRLHGEMTAKSSQPLVHGRMKAQDVPAPAKDSKSTQILQTQPVNRKGDHLPGNGSELPMQHRIEDTHIVQSPVVAASEEDTDEQSNACQLRGPVVQESQNVYLRDAAMSSSPLTVPERRLSRIVHVPATQQESPLGSGADLDREDSLPSFAAFNSSRPTADADFVVYEDGVDGLDRSRAHESQPQPDPYLFKRSMPPPNSSVKLVRPGSASNKLRASSHRTPMPQRFELRTPEPRGTPGVNSDAPHLSPVASSSPGFIVNAKTNRTAYGHQLSGSRKKRDNGQGNLGSASHPNRAASLKRKADSQIIDGYEDDRKQRGASIVEPRGLASQPQPSALARSSKITDLPRVQSSHMRSSAGTATRSTRTSKKMTKNEEMNARFARELHGH